MRMSIKISTNSFNDVGLRKLQGGREVTVHPDNTHLRLNLSLHSTAQHAVQCKMAVWQQCPR